MGYTVVTRGAGHMLSEKSQRTQDGTMFVDLDWPLNASRRLSATAELLVTRATHSAVFATATCLSVCPFVAAGIVFKRLNLS